MALRAAHLLVEWRYYLWIVILFTLAIGLKCLPNTMQVAVCSTYQGSLKDKLIKLMCEQIGTNEGICSASYVEGDGSMAGTLLLCVDKVFCPQEESVESKEMEIIHRVRSISFKTHSKIVLGCAVLAFVICLLLPARPSRKDALEFAEHIAHPKMAGGDVVQARERKELLTILRDLAVRTAQFRSLLIYAVGSGVITAFFPPNTNPGLPFWTNENVVHALWLVIMACSAACWATQRPALKYVGIGSIILASRIGFGGVFFAGLIALMVSLPYRIANSTAPLTAVQIQWIILMRLMVFPLLALVMSFVCAVIVRRLYNKPLNLWKSTPV